MVKHDDGAHEAQQQQRADDGEDRDRVEEPIGLREHHGIDARRPTSTITINSRQFFTDRSPLGCRQMAVLNTGKNSMHMAIPNSVPVTMRWILVV